MPAKDLKPLYKVYGHFYTIDFEGGSFIECRSVLEIIKGNDVPGDINVLSLMSPDCVFIMMNPGSSRPLNEYNPADPQRVKAEAMNELDVIYVPARPDTTQYQVMRVMHAKSWKHVRVLNLSDVRDAQSGNFYTRFEEVENYSNGDVHSIFSKKRQNEVVRKLNRKENAPIICAWGVNDKLDPLISRCIDCIEDQKCLVGLEKGLNKYYHPLPTLQSDKEKWVSKIIKKLN